MRSILVNKIIKSTKILCEKEILSSICVVCYFCLINTPLWAQNLPKRNNTFLKVGTSRASITPDIKIKNWITGESYLSLDDSIYSRAIVLDDGEKKFVILTWEIVDAGNSAVKTIKETISNLFNIPEKNILVNASHNHSAPWAPVYGENSEKGKERYPWWVTRYMPAQDGESSFEEWKELLVTQSVRVVGEAINSLQPVSMWVGRYDISRFIQNRRARRDSTGLIESGWLGGYNYYHPLWDPKVLSGEFTFGPIDRTMTVVSFKNDKNINISTLFNFGCHAISVYPYDVNTISGDWPGRTIRILNETLGGDNLFLQGAAGDINPSWLWSKDIVEKFPGELAKDIQTTYKFSSQFISTPMIIDIDTVDYLLTPYAQRRFGLKSLKAVIQVVSIGNLAIVALPGEPMTEIGQYIIGNSPYPQTIVLGYSNGHNQYYGMPHEKKYGGYETRDAVGIGEIESGFSIAQRAVSLINRAHKSFIKNKRN